MCFFFNGAFPQKGSGCYQIMNSESQDESADLEAPLKTNVLVSQAIKSSASFSPYLRHPSFFWLLT